MKRDVNSARCIMKVGTKRITEKDVGIFSRSFKKCDITSFVETLSAKSHGSDNVDDKH